MKRVLLICLTILLGSLAFSEGIFRAGAQLGTNMEAADGYAFVGGVHADALVFPNAGILAGTQMDFTAGSGTYSSNSSVYFEWLVMNDQAISPFLKTNLGMYVLYDDDVAGPHQAGFYFAFGAGVNIELTERFYLAPAVSFGVPFLWSPTLSAGVKL